MFYGALSLFVLGSLHRVTKNLLEALWRGAEGFAVVLVDFVAIGHPWAGKADHLPTNNPDVAAMQRITEHAFYRVGSHEQKKVSALNLFETQILLLARHAGKIT